MALAPASGTSARVAGALRCAVCGGPLDARGDFFRCSDDHPGVRVHADTAHGKTNIVGLCDERTSKELVLKIRTLGDRVTTEEQLERTTENEAATIVRVSRALGNGPYRVPELVAGVVPTRGVLMRRLHGRCLEDELGADAWLRPRGVGRGSERAGEWLARLVTTTEVGRMPFSPDETVARAREFLDEIAERGHAPPRSAVWRIWSRRRRRGRRVRRPPAASCTVTFAPDTSFSPPTRSR